MQRGSSINIQLLPHHQVALNFGFVPRTKGMDTDEVGMLSLFRVEGKLVLALSYTEFHFNNEGGISRA